MNNSAGHIASEQLHALIDRQLDATDHAHVTEHLLECARCRSLYESLVAFDAAFKRMPLERAGDAFTEKVTQALGLAPSSALLTRLLQDGAYALALLIVLGVMTAVFALTGVIPSSQPAPERIPGPEILTQLGGALSDAAVQLVHWLGEYFPFGRGALSVSVAVGCVLGALALIDRSLGKRIVHRARY
ncbi:MAG TPA: zf-HC2 domain-containing protein [Bacteroidota bacterium]|nr:zf-HC2 domain-containing protein [Bacteroidota bacterium]